MDRDRDFRDGSTGRVGRPRAPVATSEQGIVTGPRAGVISLQRSAGNTAVVALVVGTQRASHSVQRRFSGDMLPVTFGGRAPQQRGTAGPAPSPGRASAHAPRLHLQRLFTKDHLPVTFEGVPRKIALRVGDGGWLYLLDEALTGYVGVHVTVPGRMVDRGDGSGFKTTEHEDFHITLETAVGAALHFHFDEHGRFLARNSRGFASDRFPSGAVKNYLLDKAEAFAGQIQQH